MLADLFGADLIVVVVIVAILLVGGTQIPKLARSLGSAKNQFEQGLKEGQKGDAASTNGTAAAIDAAPIQAPAPAPQPAPAPPAEGQSQTS